MEKLQKGDQLRGTPVCNFLLFVGGRKKLLHKKGVER
jgi:hypothetical protein